MKDSSDNLPAAGGRSGRSHSHVASGSTRQHDKTRGALDNPAPRYQPLTVELDVEVGATGDHEQYESECTDGSRVTECRPVQARSIIASNQSPDVPFNRSINPYQGCEHGCIYCYARPTHAYLDLSPGLDFETRLTYKANAAEQLQRELSKPGYRCEPITLGANTDPYQPVERQLGITREILDVLRRCNHPVSITTKGTALERDLDLLASMAEDNLCSVAISLTSADAQLKRAMEPRAASHTARLSIMHALSERGIPVTALIAPVIPALNDRELETLVEQAANAGARSAAFILLRLPLETRDLFFHWLDTHFPLRAEHVKSVLRQSRGGRDNDSRFGHRMRGSGVFADVLSARFRVACKRHGLANRETHVLRTDLFDASRLGGQPAGGQQDLFG